MKFTTNQLIARHREWMAKQGLPVKQREASPAAVAAAAEPAAAAAAGHAVGQTDAAGAARPAHARRGDVGAPLPVAGDAHLRPGHETAERKGEIMTDRPFRYLHIPADFTHPPRLVAVTLEDYKPGKSPSGPWLENWKREVAGWDAMNAECDIRRGRA